MNKQSQLDAFLLSAARALSTGDPVTALSMVGIREDAHALAIRGIALAQLAEYPEALELLSRSLSCFEEQGQALYAARSRAARAEVFANLRDFSKATLELEEASNQLSQLGDFVNATWVELVRARLLRLAGDRKAAAQSLATSREMAEKGQVPYLLACVLLAEAEASMRTFSAAVAAASLERALELLNAFQHPLLEKEICRQRHALDQALVRLSTDEEELVLSALELEQKLDESKDEVVLLDVVRRKVFAGREVVLDLQRLPVIFDLILALAERWPQGCKRQELIDRAFGNPVENTTDANRLRVALVRVRERLAGIASVKAIEGGWELNLNNNKKLAILRPQSPISSESHLLALLSDGAAWAAKDLSLASGRSLRSVQRGLKVMVEQGQVSTSGSGPTRRYAALGRAEIYASQNLFLGLIGQS